MPRDAQTLGPEERAPRSSPVGLDAVLSAALRHIEGGDLRPLLFSGPGGVGKSTAALALAAVLGRPVLAFDVAVAGLRLGQRDGLRELPLVPRAMGQTPVASGGSGPVILIEQAERLPGGLVGSVMTALLGIAAERNARALSHYFGVEARAEDVLFVFTTRAVTSVMLESQMLVCRMDGYCRVDKEAIVLQHFKAVGKLLDADRVRDVVRSYLPGPGVAELPALVSSTWALAPEEMLPVRLAPILGAPAPSLLARYTQPHIGQAIAMAWTHEGGTHLVVEACLGQLGEGEVIVVGNVGDIMQGSARVALHAVNQLLEPSERLGGSIGRPVLINLPGSWAYKKEGQSAGLAMALAMYGLATGKAVPRRLAVTGEVSLGGLVLPVLGCRAKMLAAEREGIERIFVPEGNRGDALEAPPALRGGLEIGFVSSLAECISAVFGK